MARFPVSALAAVLLLLSVALGASRSTSQKEGFESINCGGGSFTDPTTKLNWEADPFNNENNGLLHGRVGNVESSFRSITPPFTTLRYFPSDRKNGKFCYQLNVFDGRTYLVRSSFLYGNYDGLRQPPTFLLLFNYDEWVNVNTSLSTTPIVHELTFVSTGNDLNICLAPNPSTNHTPFISTIELRLLKNTMYNQNVSGSSPSALSKGYGLKLWKRINYGARTEAVIRYPEDPYDRIWEANTTGPTLSVDASQVGVFYGEGDESQPPQAVMATAITSNDPTGNLSFTYDGYGGDGGFRMEMHFQELDARIISGHMPLRQFLSDFFRSNVTTSMNSTSIAPVVGGSQASFADMQTELSTPLHITFYPVLDSPLGPLLNAIELFFWTPQPLTTDGTSQGDVFSIQQIQDNFNLQGYGQGDPCVPKAFKWAWIACSDDSPPRITEINLANLNLEGEIPPIINNLTSLQKVNLSHNKLIGPIPDVHDLHNLKYLDVSYNSLCGRPPSNLSSIENINIVNSGLCDESTCECNSKTSCSTLAPNDNKKRYIFVICFMGALNIVLLLLLFIIYKTWQTRRKEEKATSDIKTNQKDYNLKGLAYLTKMFTYDEIKSATMDFTTILGQGGFGKVYHGLLPTGEAIAVKMLVDASKQGLKEFYNEVVILSRVRHKNLVSLLGYCVENTYMLIYEYIEKGNLRDILYGEVESKDKPLPWKTRLHIALDASQGLDYLHMGCDPAIIHRDVKSSNILLSDKMQAKVADFGLSRLKEGDITMSHVSTHNVVGTAGYLDPVYNATNQLTDKSDVFSFGIVLLELICARAPIDMFTSPPYILEWAKSSIMEGKLEDIVDPMLQNGYRMDSLLKVVDLAFRCVDDDRLKRPKMSEVSQVLQLALEIEMDKISPTSSKDVSESSSTMDEKLSTLQNIKSMHELLDPR